MGQKTNPVELRLGLKDIEIVNRSKWYANNNNYADVLHLDITVRNFILKKAKAAMIAEINIERSANENPVTAPILVTISCIKTGVISGKGGANITQLLSDLKREIHKQHGKLINVKIVLKEIKKSEYHASLISQAIAISIEKRVNPKRAMRREIERVMRTPGIAGIKVIVSGRIGGADIARSEKQSAGRVPLHTLKANIRYHSTTALTTYGIMGIKVWIYVENQIDSRKSKEITDAAAS